jgi:hypothetical protein
MSSAIGSIPCRGLGCQREIPVGKTSTGTLSLACGFCGFSAYAKAGTRAARAIEAAMTPEPGMEPEPKAQPVAAPATATTTTPAPKPANSVFTLGGLA